MLLENRRMNDVLNSLVNRPAKRDHYPKITYETPDACGSDLNQLCLDPNYPVVVVLSDSPRATSENHLEVGIVRALVLALKDGVQLGNGCSVP